MIRNVDLVSYLPTYLQNYNRETVAALQAENPEFRLVWNAADRVLKNEFIATADEYGISRFENILKILPSKEDTLESRRARVQSRWFAAIPYTMRALIAKLIGLCGEGNFSVTEHFLEYRLEIVTDLPMFGQVEELERMIDELLPCNMVVDIKNDLACNVNGTLFLGGGVVQTDMYTIST